MMEIIQLFLQRLQTAGAWRNKAGQGGQRHQKCSCFKWLDTACWVSDETWASSSSSGPKNQCVPSPSLSAMALWGKGKTITAEHGTTQQPNIFHKTKAEKEKAPTQESKSQCKNEMITLSLCLALPFLKHQTYSGAFKNHWQLKMSVWLTNQKNVNSRVLNCIIWVNMYLYSLERKALLFNCWTAAATQELFWFIMQIMQFGTPIMGIKNAK